MNWLASWFGPKKPEDLSKLSLDELKEKNKERREALLEKFAEMPVDSHKLSRGLVGLSNMGNTCYMNSALQCLTKTDELRDYLLQMKWFPDLNGVAAMGTQGELFIEFVSLVKKMHEREDGGSMRPSDFKSRLGKKCPQVACTDLVRQLGPARLAGVPQLLDRQPARG